ncbi:MAG: glucose 1-dehydrogenase [Ectothiorhodospiraceae bacterium]|nr:glucose 1-dehydrogenase [Chromatiales bacterium]MCP5154335.1 glucose 1-dehydrogenase [Ectothiorhodospiraceae bacterium]
MRLSGKTVLITGAARGIGQAIAERLAAAGADVAVADLRRGMLDETVSRIEAHGRRAVAIEVDVTQRAQVDAMVRSAAAELGRIDAFFANAGIIEVQNFLDVDEGTYDRIMAVNTKGVFLCGQAVARQMIAQGDGGRIVVTASVASRVGIPDMAAYAASKAAAMSLTRSMALALAPHGINVNALAPGIVSTDMWVQIDAQRGQLRNKAVGESLRERVSTIPLGRAAIPADVAAVAEFLVSDDAAYLTGQTINIDGGALPS